MWEPLVALVLATALLATRTLGDALCVAALKRLAALVSATALPRSFRAVGLECAACLYIPYIQRYALGLRAFNLQFCASVACALGSGAQCGWPSFERSFRVCQRQWGSSAAEPEFNFA